MHVITFSAVTWDFPLVGRTRMITEAWLALRAPTTFVQVPSLRTLAQRVTGRGTRDDPSPVDGRPIVVRPLPGPPARFWPVLGDRGVRAAIRAPAASLARRLGTHVDLASACGLVVSPVWTPWLDHLPLGRIIYDCIDDPDVHAPRPHLVPLIRRWERELIERADAAAITARGLGEHLGSIRPDLPVSLVRNGVDAELFRSRANADPRPDDLPTADPSRPIVGFVGALYDWIDWQLIEGVVRALPDHRFIFVGPHAGQAAAARVASIENATFLGPRPYGAVPSYMAAFDVAWVPFDASRVSALANPIKIYEYLSLGLPVVTTPVADAGELQRVCRVASGVEAVTAAIRETGSGDSDLAQAERRAFADQHTWRARARELHEFCTRRLVGH